jgi:hypothetical protein
MPAEAGIHDNPTQTLADLAWMAACAAMTTQNSRAPPPPEHAVRPAGSLGELLPWGQTRRV